VNNRGDLWELDVGYLASHNDMHRYLLNANHAFCKYSYSVPIRSKTGESVASAFLSIMANTRRSRNPLAVRKTKGKDFVNARFLKLLDGQVIEVRVCRNSDLNCSVLELCKSKLKCKLSQWFMRNNTYRYVDVLDKLVSGYDDTVHSST